MRNRTFFLLFTICLFLCSCGGQNNLSHTGMNTYEGSQSTLSKNTINTSGSMENETKRNLQPTTLNENTRDILNGNESEAQREVSSFRTWHDLSKTVSFSPYIFQGTCIKSENNNKFRVQVIQGYRGVSEEEVLVQNPSQYPLELGKEYLFFTEKHGNVMTDQIYYAVIDLLEEEDEQLKTWEIEDLEGWTYATVLSALPALTIENPCVFTSDIHADYIHSSDREVVISQSDCAIRAKSLKITSILHDRMWVDFEILRSEKGDLQEGKTVMIVVPLDSVREGEIYTVCCHRIGETENYIISAPNSIWPVECGGVR